MKDLVTFISRRIHTSGNPPFAGYVRIKGSTIDLIGEGLPDYDEGVMIDVGTQKIVPGFIDLHVHGCGGYDAVASEQDPIPEMAKFLAKHGTTAFQPTSGASPLKLLDATIERVKAACYSKVAGSRVLGLHMEGPFLNKAKKGAMAEEYIIPASMGLVEKWVTQAQGTLSQMTIAPELPNAHEVIRYLVKQGIAVAAGHTDATYEEMQDAFRAGVSVGSHTFNAMRGIHQREPGALGALLTQEGVTCELIADGHHVHPGVIRLLVASKGARYVCLVTDAMLATGLGEGEYQFMSQTVKVDGHGHAVLPGGSLAGSTATMNRCLKTVVEGAKIPFETALLMATLNPARVAGVDQRKGSLAVGKDADLVVLDDDYKVMWSVAEGVIYKSPEGSSKSAAGD